MAIEIKSGKYKIYHIPGKKIGCTNKAAQEQLNVNESFFGNMFSDNISKNNTIIKIVFHNVK